MITEWLTDRSATVMERLLMVQECPAAQANVASQTGYKCPSYWYRMIQTSGPSGRTKF
jgi:hypothetical protein